VVRKPAQVALLRGQGAKHVVDSSEASFMEDLIAALEATGATLAFDATGGGKLAGQILTAMEVAQTATATEYNRYGSTTHKQVYLYGSLDRSPTTFNRAFGMAWGIGGWLLTPFLQKIGGEGVARLRGKVRDEIKTTFASHYTKEVSLAEALSLDAIEAYGRQATGEKFLIRPAK
jgi:NADPH2:quinone reductase